MHKISRTAALAVAVAALAAPAAQAQAQSPDARDAASGWTGGRPHQNLASPDAQDAAQGRGTFSAPQVTVLKVPQQPYRPLPCCGQPVGMEAFRFVIGTVLAVALNDG